MKLTNLPPTPPDFDYDKDKSVGISDEETAELIRMVNRSPMCLEPLDEGYRGKVRLRGGVASGADDFIWILLNNEYRVTAEIEKDDNGVSYTVISFGKPQPVLVIKDDTNERIRQIEELNFNGYMGD